MSPDSSGDRTGLLTRTRRFLWKGGSSVLFEGEHWCRIEMNRHIEAHLQSLDKEFLEAVEVSGNGERGRGWKTFESLRYPEFDLCTSQPTDHQYDVVLCEQVLEHVTDPIAAVKTLHALTKPGGEVVVGTPFMLRIHEQPGDYWRFTKDGLRLMLERGGFERVETFSWGNRDCVSADLMRWMPYRLFKRLFSLHWRAYQPWQSLRNEEEFPVMVWAYARRPA
ncbi:MAG: methyltransferase domain-containing protein [Acidimicrobiales bacterium]